MSYWVAIAQCKGSIGGAVVGTDEDMGSVKASKRAARIAYREFAERYPATASEVDVIPAVIYCLSNHEVDEMTFDGLRVKVEGRAEDVPPVTLKAVSFRDITDC